MAESDLPQDQNPEQMPQSTPIDWGDGRKRIPWRESEPPTIDLLDINLPGENAQAEKPDKPEKTTIGLQDRWNGYSRAKKTSIAVGAAVVFFAASGIAQSIFNPKATERNNHVPKETGFKSQTFDRIYEGVAVRNPSTTRFISDQDFSILLDKEKSQNLDVERVEVGYKGCVDLRGRLITTLNSNGVSVPFQPRTIPMLVMTDKDGMGTGRYDYLQRGMREHFSQLDDLRDQYRERLKQSAGVSAERLAFSPDAKRQIIKFAEMSKVNVCEEAGPGAQTVGSPEITSQRTVILHDAGQDARPRGDGDSGFNIFEDVNDALKAFPDPIEGLLRAILVLGALGLTGYALIKKLL